MAICIPQTSPHIGHERAKINFVQFINLQHCGFDAEITHQTIGWKKRMHNKLGLNNLSR